MRSQDVLHSAYMPHFRAQMNCVPGMITQFSFTPTVTTSEMRLKDDIIDKVNNINEIRREKNAAWANEVWSRTNSIIYYFVIRSVAPATTTCK